MVRLTGASSLALFGPFGCFFQLIGFVAHGLRSVVKIEHDSMRLRISATQAQSRRLTGISKVPAPLIDEPAARQFHPAPNSAPATSRASRTDRPVIMCFSCRALTSGLALEVIVGDDEGLLRLLGDGVDARLPAAQLRIGVEIVVAIVARIAVEPLLVVAAVQANVATGAVTCSLGVTALPSTG